MEVQVNLGAKMPLGLGNTYFHLVYLLKSSGDEMLNLLYTIQQTTIYIATLQTGFLVCLYFQTFLTKSDEGGVKSYLT